MKASPKGEEQAVDISELTPEEANRIIHSRRKVRYGESLLYLGDLASFSGDFFWQLASLVALASCCT